MMSKKTVKYIFCSLSMMCLLALGHVVYAQNTNRSTISGFVFSPERRPLQDLPVELRNEVNTVLQRVRTDGSGRYYFTRLSSGRFSIRVLTLGRNIEAHDVDVEISGIGVRGQQLADNVQQDIYTKYRKNSNGEPVINGIIFAQEVPPDAEKQFRSAVSDLETQRMESGMSGLRRAIDIFPTYFLALERLGLEQIKMESFEDAISTLEKAVAVNANSYTSQHALGYAQYRLKRYEPAVASLKKAVAANNFSSDALLLLGINLRELKEYPESEKALLQAAKVADNDVPNVHWNLALLYAHNMKRFKDAADQLELYIKQSDDLPNKETIKKLIKQFREKAKTASS